MLAALLLLFTQCKGSKTTVPENTGADKVKSDVTLECDFNAVIKLDDDLNCKVVLVLPNGLIIQPSAELPGEASFEDGEKVRVSYKIIEDMATTCNMAVAMADITCLVKVNGSQKEDCANVRDPFDVEWMIKAVNVLDARKVSRYTYMERRAYMFSGLSETVIYDCYGQELCRFRAAEEKACMEVISKLSNEFVILVVNE